MNIRKIIKRIKEGFAEAKEIDASIEKCKSSYKLLDSKCDSKENTMKIF